MKNNHHSPFGLPNVLFTFVFFTAHLLTKVNSNKDDHINARRLYNHLMFDYNSFVSPVYENVNVNVSIGLKLIQFSLNLRDQVLSSNVIVEQRWIDRRLTWNPAEFGNLDKLHILAKNLWLPDIVIYNNADADNEIGAKLNSKVLVNSNGLIEWHPVVNLKSNCVIDLYYYPLDTQNCKLRFGSETKERVNLHLNYSTRTLSRSSPSSGIDLSLFNENQEYDLINVPAQLINKRTNHHFDQYSKSYQEIVFYIKLRSRTMLLIFQLLLPAMIINFLTSVVFYLPSYSNKKLTLSVSLLLTLTILMFYTVESTPTISLSLINRYLFFTFCQVTLCIFLSTIIISISCCSPISCKPGLITRLLLRYLNKLLKIRRPNSDHFKIDYFNLNNPSTNSTARSSFSGFCYPSSACQSLMSKYHLESSQSDIELHSRLVCSRKDEEQNKKTQSRAHSTAYSSSSSSSKSTNSSSKCNSSSSSSSSNKESEKQNLVEQDNNSKQETSDLANNLNNDLSLSVNKSKPFEFAKAVHNINSMANRIQNVEQYSKVKDDWQFLALLLDRLFLWLFFFSSILGWLYILQAPYFS